MISRQLQLVLTAVVFTLFSQSTIANSAVLQSVPLPVNASIETIAVDMIQNGHRISIAKLETTSNIDDTLQFYREQWSAPLAEGVPGFVENNAGDWSIISRLEDGWNQVVQVRPSDQGLEGRISVMNLKPARGGRPQLPMPSGANLLSSTESDDIGHTSNTFVVVARLGVDAVAEFYRRHFDTEGWSRVSDQSLDGSQVMLLQRRGERAEIVVSRLPGSGSLAVVNKVLDDE